MDEVLRQAIEKYMIPKLTPGKSWQQTWDECGEEILTDVVDQAAQVSFEYYSNNA